MLRKQKSRPPKTGERLGKGCCEAASFLKKKKPGFLWRCCTTKIPADSHMIIFWKLSKKLFPFWNSVRNQKRALLISSSYLAEPVQKAYQGVFASMELLKIVLTFYPRESNNHPANSQYLPARSTLDATYCKLHLKCCVNMAPPVGLEPTTHGLTVRRSTDWAKGEYNCWHYLSSRAVTRQVLSAYMSLTSVFGMGTGGPSCQSTPTIYLLTAKAENNFTKRTNSKEWWPVPDSNRC